MPKLRLKGMKMVLSESGPSNTGGCEVVFTISAPTPSVAPHNSIPSSSADSNLNEEGANQNNNTRLENVQPINEAVNLNTVDSNGRQMKRGRTTLKELWSLPPQEKVLVKENHLGQPIGPEAQLLAGFLGMLARSGQRVGLQYESWHKVPKTLKDGLFKFIEVRFALEIPKEYVLKSLGKKWRDYKHELKRHNFKREDGMQANKDKHPDGTIRWQWEQLVDFWYSRKGEDSEKLGLLVESNKNIRILQDQRVSQEKKRKWRLPVEEK